MQMPATAMETALLERFTLLQQWYRTADESRRTMDIQPLYVRLWIKLGAKLEARHRPVSPEDNHVPPDPSSVLVLPRNNLCAPETPWRRFKGFSGNLFTLVLWPLRGLQQYMQNVFSYRPAMARKVVLQDIGLGGALAAANSTPLWCRGPAPQEGGPDLKSQYYPPTAQTNSTVGISPFEGEYRQCYVCDGDGCPMRQPNMSDIQVPNWAELGNWTAHRLPSPSSYSFNKDYAAIRLSVASEAITAAGGGTKAVKGASRAVQVQSYSALTGSTGIWTEYDLMTSVWLSFTVISLYRNSGMQPVMAFQKAAMACTIPDYAGTADGEDQKYAATALKVSTQGFDTIARYNRKDKAGAELIAAVLTRPGYGRHTGADVMATTRSCGIDRNTWLHMRWYDGGVVPYFMCHDWSLAAGLGRLTNGHTCSLVDSCYDITIWLNDLSDYALDRTIGEGGNSLVYAISQSGGCNPAVLADFCSDTIDKACACQCNSTLHDVAADIAVGFTAMYAWAFRYRGLENAWLARKVEVPGVVHKGWLVKGGSMTQHEWPRVPYRSDWGPLNTTLPAEVDLNIMTASWRARCGRLAETGPGSLLVSHVIWRFAKSESPDERIVCESLRRMWQLVEPTVEGLGGDFAAIYASVEMLVLSLLEWPALFAASGRVMGQCSVRDKVTLENTILGSAAYGLWCCGTSDASAFIRFLTGLAASISELTIVATYRRIPTLWSENQAGWEPTEHMDCIHTSNSNTVKG